MTPENLHQPYTAKVEWSDETLSEFEVIDQLVLPKGSPTPVAITIADEDGAYRMTPSGIRRAIGGK